jgi:hypothetical protein
VDGKRSMEKVDMDEEKYNERVGESLMERDGWRDVDEEKWMTIDRWREID